MLKISTIEDEEPILIHYLWRKRLSAVWLDRVLERHQMNSTFLQWQVIESFNRLIGALADEQKAHDLCADNPGNATKVGRWRTAQRRVQRTADCYSSGLKDYLEAVLSAMAHGKLVDQPNNGQRRPLNLANRQ